jgi:hypothetical protein
MRGRGRERDGGEGEERVILIVREMGKIKGREVIEI